MGSRFRDVLRAPGARVGMAAKGMTEKVTTAGRTATRGASHIGKEAYKFQFDMTVKELYGVGPGTFALKWTRGKTIVMTEKIVVKKRPPKDVVSTSQKLEITGTMYRDKKTSEFDAKESKISLLFFKNGIEKTIAKVYFDMKEFVGVPSLTKERTLTMAPDKFKVTVMITSKFLKVSKGGPGTNSISSSIASGRSMGSTAIEDDMSQVNADVADLDDLDDFGDLDDLDFDAPHIQYNKKQTETSTPAKSEKSAAVSTTTAAALVSSSVSQVSTGTAAPDPKATSAPAVKATPAPATKATPAPAMKATPAPVTKATPAPAAKATPAPVTKAAPALATTATTAPPTKATPASVQAPTQPPQSIGSSVSARAAVFESTRATHPAIDSAVNGQNPTTSSRNAATTQTRSDQTAPNATATAASASAATSASALLISKGTNNQATVTTASETSVAAATKPTAPQSSKPASTSAAEPRGTTIAAVPEPLQSDQGNDQWKSKFEQSSRENSELKSSVQKLSTENANLTKTVEDLQAQVKDLRGQLKTATAAAAASATAASAVSISRMEEQVAVLEKEKSAASAEAASVSSQLKEVSSKAAAFEKNNQEVRASYDDLTLMYTKLRNEHIELKAKKKTAETSEVEADETVAALARSPGSKVHSLQTELESERQLRELMKEEMEELRYKASEYEADLVYLKKERASLQSEIEANRQHLLTAEQSTVTSKAADDDEIVHGSEVVSVDDFDQSSLEENGDEIREQMLADAEARMNVVEAERTMMAEELQRSRSEVIQLQQQLDDVKETQWKDLEGSGNEVETDVAPDQGNWRSASSPAAIKEEGESLIVDNLVESKMRLAEVEEENLRMRHLIHRMYRKDPKSATKIEKEVPELNQYRPQG